MDAMDVFKIQRFEFFVEISPVKWMITRSEISTFTTWLSHFSFVKTCLEHIALDMLGIYKNKSSAVKLVLLMEEILHQLRLVVFPVIYGVFYIQVVWATKHPSHYLQWANKHARHPGPPKLRFGMTGPPKYAYKPKRLDVFPGSIARQAPYDCYKWNYFTLLILGCPRKLVNG